MEADIREANVSERSTMVLTGASRGIGHATAKRFLSAGWHIITVSSRPFDSDCPWIGGDDAHVQIDLSNIDSIEAGIGQLKQRLHGGQLHALVNNAGISPKGPGGARLGTVDTPTSVWTRVHNVNFLAPVLLARGLFAELAAAQGSIVNITSIAGSRVHPFAGAAYATSKAALAALTREMAADFGPAGIRVNSIAPGEIDTGILSPGTNKLVEQLPLRRLGKPEEVAAVIYFLCTTGAAYVNGSTIHIDGGQHV